MTDTLEHTAKRIADRGRDALLARLRPAFADAASAHAEILPLDDQQLEQMVQRAADRADGLQWRRALATVATQELGIGLGEALGHPAVERAQAIVGAPSYEDSLAALEGRSDAPVPEDLRRKATRPEAQAPSPADRSTQLKPDAATRAETARPEPTTGRIEPAPTRPEPTTGRVEHEPAQPEPTVRRIERKPQPETAAAPAAQSPPRPTPASSPPAEQKPTQPEPAAAQAERKPPQQQAEAPTQSRPVPDVAKPEPKSPPGRPEPMSAAARQAPPASRPAPQAAKAPAEPRPAPRRPPPTARPSEPEGMRVAAIHLGGVTNLRPGESDIELRLSEHGLDIARDSGEIIGRLGWDEIQGLEVPPPRGLMWRRRAPRSHLVVRAGNGDASFEIPSVYPDELTEHLGPVLQRYGRRLAMR